MLLLEAERTGYHYENPMLPVRVGHSREVSAEVYGDRGYGLRKVQPCDARRCNRSDPRAASPDTESNRGYLMTTPPIRKQDAITVLVTLLIRDVRQKMFERNERTTLRVILNNLEELKTRHWEGRA